jgi:choloylglycine hydrolase
MNDQGLVVEEVSYGPSVYPTEDARPVTNEMQWIQFQLDRYASVKEVLEALTDVRIEKYLFGIHYLVCDRTGDTAVIGFIDGKMKVYTGRELPVRVLSNNTYENSLRYLDKHQGFGGNLAVRRRAGSQERFLWAASLIKNYIRIQNGSPAAYGHTILNDVRQADTRWSILYQPTVMAIDFKMPDTRTHIRLRFAEVDLTGLRIYPLSALAQDTCRTITFVPAAAAKDQELVQQVLEKLIRYEAVDRADAERIHYEMQQYRRECEYPGY